MTGTSAEQLAAMSAALRRTAEQIRDQAKQRPTTPPKQPTMVIPVAVNGVVVCGAQAYFCWCKLPPHGDDQAHKCGAGRRCTGQWVGDYSDPASFRVVMYPGAGGARQ